MKSTAFLIVSLLSLSLTANAAQFEKIRTVKSTSLTRMLSIWKVAIDGSEDASWSAAKVTKKDSEKWANTVKQYLHKEGADHVDMVQRKLESFNSRKELKQLVSQNYYVAEHLSEHPDLEDSLVEALDDITGNKLVFVARVEGDTFSYDTITFVDVTRMELLNINAGTSD